ncbi:MAG: winged helix DNA-binding domain-containing protein [Prolixibacteraceae bacterium]|nr:winged helix DNA-binding domain-containing protein [Prolixibacteraceae bacterium]
MNTTDISTLRLQNQQVSATKFKTVKELVGWMGAMQAQDYNQAKWAIGARLPHLTETQIESAFNQGDIFRTHLMRPTWHFVSADNIYWMLQLTSKQIKSITKSRKRDLGLTENDLAKSKEVLVKSLEGNRSLTREELSDELNRAGINTFEQRLPHILMDAEIDGIICSGGIQGKNQAYALLAERVPVKKTFSREESLALLVKKYFTSHGPATLPDFVWWSGLPVAEARKALEMNKTILNSEIIDNETYWFANSVDMPSTLHDSVYLLPAFDEYLISYKNRSSAITLENHTKAISNNGIFRPIIVVNGQISGLWKRTIKKDSVLIELDHFRPHNKKEIGLIENAAEMFGHFTGRKVEVKIQQ